MSVEKLYLYDRKGSGFGSPRTKALVHYSLKRVMEQQGFDLNDELDNKSVWSPEKLFEGLERYNKPSVPSWYVVDEKVWHQAYIRTLTAFGRNGDILNKLEDDGLLQAVQLEKSSGLPLLQKKSVAFERDFRRMQRIRNDQCAPPPCMAYHRVQHGDKGPKVRLVWGYPLSMTLLEAQFAAPLIENFLKLQTPMVFGYRKLDLWARIVPVTRYEKVVGLDYSGFDSSVSRRLISMAFKVLGTWFSPEDREAGNWDKIQWYFANTSILMPDGHVYKKDRGIPSGSYFTQLVGSVVNYFALMYLAEKTGSNVDALVLGDDSLFGIKGDRVDGWTMPMWEWNVPIVLAELGLVVNAAKSKYYLGRSRQAVHFLGHTWSHGYPHRPVRDVVVRAVYPERYQEYRDKAEAQRQRMMMLLGDAVESWIVMKKYFTPSRHGICYSTAHGCRGVVDKPEGWLRHLAVHGKRIRYESIPYTGLLT